MNYAVFYRSREEEGRKKKKKKKGNAWLVSQEPINPGLGLNQSDFFFFFC